MIFTLPFADSPSSPHLLPCAALTFTPPDLRPPLVQVQGCCTASCLYLNFSTFQHPASLGSAVTAVISLPHSPVIAVEATPLGAACFQYSPGAVPFQGSCSFDGGENLTGIYWGCRFCLPLSALQGAVLYPGLPLKMNCFLLDFDVPQAALFPFSGWEKRFSPSLPEVLESLSPCVVE